MHLQEGIRHKLRMAAQILKIRIGQRLAQCVRKSSDSKLENRSIVYLRQNESCHFAFFRSRLRRFDFNKRMMIALNYIVDFAYVNPRSIYSHCTSFIYAVCLWQPVIDLDDHNVRCFKYRLCRCAGEVKAEESFVVHWSNAHHCNVYSRIPT